MRLGFYYHVAAAREGDGIKTAGFLGRFLDAIAACCDHLVLFLHSPASQDLCQLDYRLVSSNVSLVEMGPCPSVPRSLLGVKSYEAVIREHRSEYDALLIRGPSTLLPDLARAARPVPVALLIVGDFRLSNGGTSRGPIGRALIRRWADWNTSRQIRSGRNAITFVNSPQLYASFKPHVACLVETRTSTLTDADAYSRDDTCQSAPVHLLYTGRIEKAKGLLELVPALATLVAAGEDLTLDLVGWAADGDTILEEMAGIAKAAGIEDRVVCHGYRPCGPELFAFYRKADIYVIPSHFEGFPRTIWEAMAHCVPVVATDVGSISDLTAGCAELVPPHDAERLASAIARVLHDPLRRQAMIRGGFGLARENTLEKQVGKMIARIDEWRVSRR